MTKKIKFKKYNEIRFFNKQDPVINGISKPIYKKNLCNFKCNIKCNSKNYKSNSKSIILFFLGATCVSIAGILLYNDWKSNKYT